MKEKTLGTRMINARKKYGASKTLMSNLCGFGVNTWANYENGKEIESLANKHLVEIAITPYGMLRLLNYYPYIYRDNANYKKVFKKVTTICEEIEKKIRLEVYKLEDYHNTEFSYDGL